MLQAEDLTIRLAETTDLPFIRDCWVKSVHKTYPNMHQVDFYRTYHRMLDALIPQATTICSVLDDSPDDIVSFLSYTGFRGKLVVFYAYTRAEERRQGFLNQLLEFANPNQLKIVFFEACRNENVMAHFARKYIFDPRALL